MPATFTQLKPVRAFWLCALQCATLALTSSAADAQATSPFTQAVSGAAGSWQQLSLDIPAGTGSLSIVLSGGTGDADLYVRFGEEPSATSFDCRPFLDGSNEACTFESPRAGAWKVGVNGFSDYEGATLTATWASPKPTATPTNPTAGLTQAVSGAVGSWQRFTVDVPEGVSSLDVVLSGSMGDADLYVRFGAEPTEAMFDCRPFLDGSNETCTIPNPRAGVWHLGVNGFTAYSGATLTATWPAAGTTQPPVMPPGMPPPMPPTTDWQTELLNKHNQLRAPHCAPAMTWDDDVAATAQAWANACTMTHAQDNPHGENLAWGGGTFDPVQLWYNEVANYDFATPGFSANTGHFTQVVWRGSTKLGCGRATCGGTIYYVCRYAPPGNVTGAYEQNVLPSGATCP